MRGLVVLLCMTLLSGCAEARPDYSAILTGEQAARDRDRLAEVAADRIGALRGKVPWLDWRESSVDHVCGVQTFGGPLSHRWEDLLCMTVTTQYAGFDGEFEAEVRAFDTAAGDTGWGDSTGHVSQPIDYYRQFRGRREGPRTYDAGDLPDIAYHGGTPGAGLCGGRDPQWALRQRWLEAGQPLTPAELADRPALPFPAHPVLLAEHDPLDHPRVKAEALAQHRYLAVITLTAQCTFDGR